MHSTPSHNTTGRVSRRGYREAQTARHLSAVEPCLQTAVSRHDLGR